jgi:large subunit ribosomal protein L18
MGKQLQRMRRAKKTRARIKRLGAYRLTVYRSLNHIYAQIISPEGATVHASASTLEKSLAQTLKTTGNTDAASLIGKTIADRAIKAGISTVAFDRSGYKYHGRVKALASAAREAGLEF